MAKAASSVGVTALALACTAIPEQAQAQGCGMAAEDVAWLEYALDAWRQAEPALLGLPAQTLPTVVAIDAQCTYVLPEGEFDGGRATVHGATATLPDGAEVPLGPISFASGEGGYFAMSLPSVWRAASVESPVGLERLMTGVLLHEMMHIRQADLADRAIAGAPKSAGIAEDELTDDIVQQRFESDPAYVAAFDAERETLFAAASAPTDEEARRLAASALEQMRARRARWFTGANAGFAALDDVFLTMEGMGQWLIYRYFLAEGVGSADVLESVRRGGRRWSQDEGLALILVVDRLLPGWQQRAFRDPDWRAERLLAAVFVQD